VDIVWKDTVFMCITLDKNMINKKLIEDIRSNSKIINNLIIKIYLKISV